MERFFSARLRGAAKGLNNTGVGEMTVECVVSGLVVASFFGLALRMDAIADETRPPPARDCRFEADELKQTP